MISELRTWSMRLREKEAQRSYDISELYPYLRPSLHTAETLFWQQSQTSPGSICDISRLRRLSLSFYLDVDITNHSSQNVCRSQQDRTQLALEAKAQRGRDPDCQCALRPRDQHPRHAHCSATFDLCVCPRGKMREQHQANHVFDQPILHRRVRPRSFTVATAMMVLHGLRL